MNSEVLESLRVGVKFLEASDQIPPRHFEGSSECLQILTGELSVELNVLGPKESFALKHVLLGLSLMTDKACLDKVEKAFKSLEVTQKPR